MSYSTSLFSQNATLEQLSIDTELGLLIMVQKTSITFFLDTLGGVHFLRHHLAAGQHEAPWRQRVPTNLPPPNHREAHLDVDDDDDVFSPHLGTVSTRRSKIK